MSEHENKEQYPTRVTDKRGVNTKKTDPPASEEQEMPTAQELPDGDTEFARQRAEEETNRQRAEEWENLSEDEKQAILAQQAAELEGTPFAGGGIKVEGETKREILAAFVIAIDLDGTATAMPLELFEQTPVEIQRDVTPRMMYRSCSEVMMDIEGAETAHLTLQMFKTVGDHMAQAQRAQALKQQLDSRGGVRGKRR